MLEDCQWKAVEPPIYMKENVDKGYNMEEQLADLVDDTDELENMASGFQERATAVERKMRREKLRSYIICAGVVLLILVILIIIVVIQFGGGGGEAPTNP